MFIAACDTCGRQARVDPAEVLTHPNTHPRMRCRDGFVNLPDAGWVVGQDPNLGGCSRSTRHHVPLGERSGAERAVMSGS